MPISLPVLCMQATYKMQILPPLELMDKLLPDSFIMSKPKDIVSGDFYWLAEKRPKDNIYRCRLYGPWCSWSFYEPVGDYFIK